MSCPSVHNSSGPLLELPWEDCLAMSARSASHTKKRVTVLGSPSLEQRSNLPSKGIADGLGCSDKSRRGFTGEVMRCNSLHFVHKTARCDTHGLILDHAAYARLCGYLQQLLKSIGKNPGSDRAPPPLRWCVKSGVRRRKSHS